MMRRAGLEDVEIGNVPADRVTHAGFWTEPLAWDVKEAKLEIVEPQVPADQRSPIIKRSRRPSVCVAVQSQRVEWKQKWFRRREIWRIKI